MPLGAQPLVYVYTVLSLTFPWMVEEKWTMKKSLDKKP